MSDLLRLAFTIRFVPILALVGFDLLSILRRCGI
jgi:hypothetical protein